MSSHQRSGPAAAAALIERSHADLPVRPDLTVAMAGVWDRLGRAGAGFTGRQRLASARVARAALAEREPLPSWVAPSTVECRLPEADLAPHLADVVYRLALHARTLTADWYADMRDRAEITPQQWVEAIEVAVAAVDGFAHAAGLPRPDLPDPAPGLPTGTADVPARSARHHWVPVLDLEDDTGGYYRGVPMVPPVMVRCPTPSSSSASSTPPPNVAPTWARSGTS
ncbi:MAG: hypothetical protein OEY70_05015 [Acidimicrobiia bacterium]|nr:hypothetical protein [Acidimicrobiia bacterium]